MKRTYQPSKVKRRRKFGFRARSLYSPHILRNRRREGRKVLTRV